MATPCPASTSWPVHLTPSDFVAENTTLLKEIVPTFVQLNYFTMRKVVIALAALAIIFSCTKEADNSDNTPGGGGSGSGGSGGGGAQQEEEVVVTTLDAYDITHESVRLVGKADFPEMFWEKHSARDIQISFFYSKEEAFVVEGEFAGIDEMSDDGTFVSWPIMDLEPSTTYYYKAVLMFLDRDDKIVEGEVKSFTTLKKPRGLIETGEVSDITEVSATITGYANPTDQMQNPPFGIICSLYYPSFTDPLVFTATERDSEEEGFFTIEAEGLVPGKRYYYVAFIGEGSSQTLGSVQSFLTPALNATVEATGVTEVSEFAVTLNGKLTMQTIKEFEPEVWFIVNNGEMEEPISCPTTLAEDGTFSYHLTGLQVNSGYHYQACARLGTIEIKSEFTEFTTTLINGQIELLPAADITEFGATLRASFTTDLSSSIERTVTFYWTSGEVGDIAEGEYVTGTPVVATAAGGDVYEATLTGLDYDKEYYFMAMGSILGQNYISDYETFHTLDLRAGVETLQPAEIQGRRATLQGRLTIDSPGELTKEAWFSCNGQRLDAVIQSDGTFSAEVTGLARDTEYSYTAYAKVQGKELHGESVSFRTKDLQVSFNNVTATDILEKSANVTGTVSTTDGDDTSLSIKVFYSATFTTKEDIIASGSSAGFNVRNADFSIEIKDLDFGTEYHYVVRCIVEDDKYFYSDVFSFTTLPLNITFSDLTVSNITETKARLEAKVDVRCCEGLNREMAFAWSETPLDPSNHNAWPNRYVVEPSSDGTISVDLTDLKVGTDYYFMVFGYIYLGNYPLGDYYWFNSERETFRTLDIRASVATQNATSVKYNSAILHGTANIGTSDDPSPRLRFIYGKTGVPESEWESIDGELQGDGTYAATPYLDPGFTYQYKFTLDILNTTFAGEAKSFTTLSPSTPPSGAVSLWTFVTRDDGTQYEIFWADRNVGASSPEDYGFWVSWGELEGKDSYYTGGYKWRGADGGSSTYSKYCPSSAPERWSNAETDVPDNKTVLDPEDDVATVKMGAGWRLPSRAEWEALFEQCSFTEVTRGDVKGLEARSKSTANNNVIFFPYGGHHYGSNPSDWTSAGFYYGEAGHYWSRELNPDDPTAGAAAHLEPTGWIYPAFYRAGYRYLGFNVRGVTE